MDSISYRMSGSGSWQNLLPDEASRRLYAEIYPNGASLPNGPEYLRKLLPSWKQAAIVRFENERVVPLGPIMTDDDLTILNPWFQDISTFMFQAVKERLDEYRMLASNLAGSHSHRKQDIDNIRTILICALTLDSWVFTRIRREMIGTYPPRDFVGNFFFWGYAFAEGPQRIFGFTTYNGLDGKQLHLIRSHRLDRRGIKAALNQRETWRYLDNLFWSQGKSGRGDVHRKEQDGSQIKIERSLQSVGLLTLDSPLNMEELNKLIEGCSFARCSRPDVLCMLFHLAYSYAADRLVDRGVIPDFPNRAGGEWGVWIS